jgi:hypothetical protein
MLGMVAIMGNPRSVPPQNPARNFEGATRAGRRRGSESCYNFKLKPAEMPIWQAPPTGPRACQHGAVPRRGTLRIGTRIGEAGRCLHVATQSATPRQIYIDAQIPTRK